MANLQYLLFFALIQINIPTEAQWNVSLRTSPLLTNSTWKQAVGYHNDTIHLFGGAYEAQSWTEYVIATNTFTNKGSDALPYESSGNSQHYTQMGDKLYWIEDETIYSYDFLWETFNTEANASYLTNDFACLTSYHDLLFVLGGFYSGALRLVQVLNTSSLSWITSVDQMIDPRRDFTCATDSSRGEIYAIGGPMESGWSTKIEKLSIKDINISEAVWQSSDNSLGYGDWGLRAVYIESIDSVLIIGHDISSIDCKTGHVEHLADLHYISRNAGVMFVENVLYVFGGYDGINTWQHITNPLLFTAPTKEMTAEPERETTPRYTLDFNETKHTISSATHTTPSNDTSAETSETPETSENAFSSRETTVFLDLNETKHTVSATHSTPSNDTSTETAETAETSENDFSSREMTIFLEIEASYGPSNSVTSDNASEAPGSSNHAHTPVYIIVFTVVAFIILMVLCGFIVYHRHNKKRGVDEEPQNKTIQMYIDVNAANKSSELSGDRDDEACEDIVDAYKKTIQGEKNHDLVAVIEALNQGEEQTVNVNIDSEDSDHNNDDLWDNLLKEGEKPQNTSTRTDTQTPN